MEILVDSYFVLQSYEEGGDWEEWNSYDTLDLATKSMENKKLNYPLEYNWRIVEREVVITDNYIAGSTILDRKELNQRDAKIEQQWESYDNTNLPGRD